jgi:hypothetical protein
MPLHSSGPSDNASTTPGEPSPGSFPCALLNPAHPDGRLLGFAGMTRDITARRETEAQLRAAQDALRRNETLSLLGLLVAGVAGGSRGPGVSPGGGGTECSGASW